MGGEIGDKVGDLQLMYRWHWCVQRAILKEKTRRCSRHCFSPFKNAV